MHPPDSKLSVSSQASDVFKRQGGNAPHQAAASPAAAAAAVAALAAEAGAEATFAAAGGMPGALAAAATAVAAKATAAAAEYGAALGGWTPVEVAWAYGHVASRAFGSDGPGTAGSAAPLRQQQQQQEAEQEEEQEQEHEEEEEWDGDGLHQASEPTAGGIGLAPFIDLLNHQAGASTPRALFLDSPCLPHDRDVTSVTSGVTCWAVTIGGSQGDREDTAAGAGPLLRAGQELCISYVHGSSAAAAQLSFGFVPPELQSAGRSNAA